MSLQIDRNTERINNMMKEYTDILAIETSCDETAAAVVRDGHEVLSNIIYTQIAEHTVYGGVVPEIASRRHIEKINYVIEAALNEAKMTLQDVDAVAVTYGPGLVGALLVGVAEAKALAWAAGKPLVGVNHIEGHIAANYIEHPELKPPYLGLIVSGGHTHLIIVKDYAEFEILGRTVDDAAGEAYDKVARAIGLGYPGGPKIDRVAKEGVPEADLAASFQKAVVDVLCEHTIAAAKQYGIREIAMAGGVSANSALRAGMADAAAKAGCTLYVPSPVYCTDNAAMIGAAAYYEYRKGVRSGWDLNAVPGLRLGKR